MFVNFVMSCIFAFCYLKFYDDCVFVLALVVYQKRSWRERWTVLAREMERMINNEIYFGVLLPCLSVGLTPFLLIIDYIAMISILYDFVSLLLLYRFSFDHWTIY
jgi:hypothetical protein